MLVIYIGIGERGWYVLVKLLILNPVGTEVWNDLVFEYARRVLSPDVEPVVRHIPGAPPYIETEYEKELAAPLVVKEVIRANQEGFSGVVINCFDDPGLEASREVSEIPVFGIGETSLMVALLLGYNLAIVSVGRDCKVLYRRRASQLGIDKRLVYVSCIDVPILDLRRDVEKVVKLLVEEVEQAKQYGVDVVVLGCGGFIGLAEPVSKVTGVPVVDPTLVTLKVAEALVKLGLKHRRLKPSI